MQKSVPRSFSTELNLPRCVPGTPESADPVLVSHDANQAPKQPRDLEPGRDIQKSILRYSRLLMKMALRADNYCSGLQLRVRLRFLGPHQTFFILEFFLDFLEFWF